MKCNLLNIMVIMSVLVFLISASAGADAVNVAGADNRIDITITTHLGDGQTFSEGDEIAYFFNVSQDAHVILIYQDAANNLFQILPNIHQPNAHFQANAFIEFPDADSPIRFRVSEPFGRESVWAFAASTAFPTLPNRILGNGLKQLTDMNFGDVLAKLRKHGESTGVSYGESKTTYITVAP